MKNQILSKEQMEHLAALGIDTTKSSMLICELKDGEELIATTDYAFDLFIQGQIETTFYAFTLYDVINLLPKTINECILNIDFDYYCFDYYYYAYDGQTSWHSVCFGSMDNILDGAYEMLIWVVENGYLNLINQKHENI